MQNKVPHFSLVRVFIFALVCLFISQGSDQKNTALVAYAMSLTVLVYILCGKRYENEFYFFCVILVLTHFAYGDAIAGVWNVLSFFAILCYFILKKRKHKVTHSVAEKFLLAVLIINNILGWIFVNPLPFTLLGKIPGIAAFFGMLMVYNMATKLELTPQRLKAILTIFCICVIYIFFITLNQTKGFLALKSAIFGGAAYIQENSPAGLFGHTELNGEYGMLMATLLISAGFSSLILKKIKLNSFLIQAGILSAIGIAILSRSRSAVILLFISILVYFLMFIFSNKYRTLTQSIKYIMWLVVLTASGIFFIKMLYIDLLLEKFSELNTQSFSLSRILSGESINRQWAFEFGIFRLQQKNWFLGYGYGTPESNITAWVGGLSADDIPEDFHNLYMSLPMIYGWSGAIAFLLLTIKTFLQLLRISLKYKEKDNVFTPFCFGFALFWLLFLANEYKINILRTPCYTMLFWIWLGLAKAVIINFYNEQNSLLGKSSSNP